MSRNPLMPVVKKYALMILAVLFAIAVFLFVYRSTLFNFFLSDDFFLITWLNSALKYPELLFKTYWAPWFGRAEHIATFDSTVFYRPIFISILFLESKIMGFNSLCFRCFNLCIELLSGLMLGLIAINLKEAGSKWTAPSKAHVYVWGYFSALLFILYPLHCEPVNWIANGIDLLVALFSLLALWSYIKWQRTRKVSFCFISIIWTILAFLTKEMAAILPPTIFVCELLILNKQQRLTGAKRTLKDYFQTIKNSIKETLPYWGILVAYLCFRKVVLGDFISGYSRSLAEPFSFSGWLQGLYILFVPLNNFIISANLFVYRTWPVLLVIAILLSLVLARKNRDLNILIFLGVWFVLTLAPVHDIFATFMSHPCGHRAGYLATAPLCIFLTYGMANLCLGNRFSALFRILAIILFSLAAIMLNTNNLAFAEAGHLTNKVILALRNYYSGKSGDPLVYITGLRRLCNGIYYLPVGPLDEVTKRPIMAEDLYHCVSLSSDDQDTSVGFLKSSVTENSGNINLLRWDSESESLQPVNLFSTEHIVTTWEGKDLKTLISLPKGIGAAKSELSWLADGSARIVVDRQNQDSKDYTVIDFNLKGIPCWSVDYIALRLRFHPLRGCKQSGAALLFTNDIEEKYSKEYQADYFVSDCCYAPLKGNNEIQEIVFPLRNLPAWTMGGKCRDFRITLPSDCIIDISKVWIPEIKYMMPLVTINTSDDLPDRVKLDDNNSEQTIGFDARSVDGCKQMTMEVIPNKKFSSFQNLQSMKSIIYLSKTVPANQGQIILKRSEFPLHKELYRVRLRALDINGNQVGFPSDIFFVSVGA